MRMFWSGFARISTESSDVLSTVSPVAVKSDAVILPLVVKLPAFSCVVSVVPLNHLWEALSLGTHDQSADGPKPNPYGVRLV